MYLIVRWVLYILPKRQCRYQTEVLDFSVFGCVEEQARGSLHMYVVYWKSLPCELLQNSVTYPDLLCSIAKAIEGMFKAEVDLAVHVEQ